MGEQEFCHPVFCTFWLKVSKEFFHFPALGKLADFFQAFSVFLQYAVIAVPGKTADMEEHFIFHFHPGFFRGIGGF